MTATRRVQANGLTFTLDEAGEGDTAALLLHGFPEGRGSWRRQLPALAALGWRAAAPDLRGYGGTSRPEGRAAYRVERLAEDALAMFDVLGARRRILIGHDWGGMIAWQVALSGAPLDGLVVLNAPHPAVFARALRGWEQKRRSWYVLFFQLPWIPERALTAGRGRAVAAALKRQSPGFPPDLLDAYRDHIVRPGAATAMLNYYRGNVRGLPRPAPEAPPLSTPTLMIWGEKDAALSLELTKGNEAFVSDFTLRRLPGVSHWVQQEAGREVNDAVARWARAKRLVPA